MPVKTKLLRRLGLIENWNWQLFWFALPIYALLTILYDAVLTGNGSYLWLVTFSAATLIEVAFVVICKRLFLTRLLHRYPSPFIGGIFAGLVNTIRNLTVAGLALELGLIESVDWLARALGGFFMGVAILVFYVSVLGSRVEHKAVMTKLRTSQLLLLAQRQNASHLLEAENKQLLSQAQQLLLPRIEKIQELLRQNHAKDDTLKALRSLVSEHVRPLSTQLNSTAKTLTEKPAPEPVEPIGTSFMTPSVNLKNVFRPGSVLLLSGTGQLLMVYMISGAQQASLTTLGVLAGWVILLVAKLLIPEHLVVKRGVAVSFLVSVATLSTLPVAALNLSSSSTAAEWALYSVTLSSPILAVLGFAISASLDSEREKAERTLQREINSLARETALFEQQMWIARRNWSFVVHGTVQAALTAAITRLSATEILEQYQIDLVKQDLTRAAAALANTPETEIDLTTALGNLAKTWQGICEVKFTFTDRATRSLQRDANARMCVNEICKEAISNAVRHGEAKNITISIDRSTDELLIIEAADDGRGFWGSAAPGIGSRMLDDLTVSWSLSNNRAIGRTVLTAKLPLLKVMAASL